MQFKTFTFDGKQIAKGMITSNNVCVKWPLERAGHWRDTGPPISHDIAFPLFTGIKHTLTPIHYNQYLILLSTINSLYASLHR